MSDKIKMSIEIPLDDEGMVGRECPICSQYFKLKPGTGLKIDYCSCPYSSHKDDSNSFFTPEQIEYARSIAIDQVL